MFKVGDKIRLLPSIVTRCVWMSEIGKVGTITDINDWGCIHVKTDYTGSRPSWPGWSLRECDIIPAMKVGEQLLFDFMR